MNPFRRGRPGPTPVPVEPAHPSGVDGRIERAARWTASRSSRRSFLSRAGRVSMMVAAGSQVAGLLNDEAHARVCGQSGVSPKCPTFDCGDIWGWCWYASGCCADGLLKKICDCCAINWPNVHGYCPSGTNVRCIVESCGSDPRVQTWTPKRIDTDDVGAAASMLRARLDRKGPTVVIAHADDPMACALAGPVAQLLGAPVISVPTGGLTALARSELMAVGATRAVLVGPTLPQTIDAQLADRGVTAERPGAAGEIDAYSAELAQWLRTHAHYDLAVVAFPEDGDDVAALAGAAAAGLGGPLVFGSSAAWASEATVVAVGDTARARTSELPKPRDVITGESLPRLSIRLARAVLAERPETGFADLTLVPDGSPLVAVAGWAGAVAVVHEWGGINEIRPFLFDERGPVEVNRDPEHGLYDVVLLGQSGRLTDVPYTELQSILNGFEIHKLIGVAGQGLPVISQPLAERGMGDARLGIDPPPPAATAGYWTARASRS